MYIYKFMNNLYIMETEKYYGLNEPDKTTTIDSSNIDYNIPGQTTENPSLNTTNTSILYKASATSNYIKRDNCPVTFTIKKHNDAIMDSSLCVIEIKTWTEGSIHKEYVYDLERQIMEARVICISPILLDTITNTLYDDNWFYLENITPFLAKLPVENFDKKIDELSEKEIF